MTPERWKQIKGVLDEALELKPEQRAAFFECVCDGDQALRLEVESLLAGDLGHTKEFLSLPTLPPALELAESSGSCAGRRIGPYEVIEAIGEGGMGTVYRAARADEQYKKQVAIKVVRRGLETPFALARFRAERQILASLEHSNIAHLLDGGTTESGLPYVVMELVAGLTIDRYCDSRQLSIEERLQLFRTVCLAVQYAHQHLVIHRDLKPGNILVTPEGAPKLLDFGIAKILDPESVPGRAEPTMDFMRLLTPEYASPEQVRGETVTTASDVYSLGVVLYVLLTGRHPYRLDRRSPEILMHAICETEPAKPSEALESPGVTEIESEGRRVERVRAARDGAREGVSKRLRGDLDNIVLMALRKDPQRRYASAEQLAEDIRRHLESLPVVARKDTLRYRASKFIARHRVGVAATLLVAIALLAALFVTMHEARVARRERARAERRFNDVRKLADSLIFEIHDSVAAVPGTTATRKLIVDRGLEYLDGLARESASDPSLQSELAAAYRRIGDAQGGQFASNLGDTNGALQSFQKALEIRRQILAQDPNRLENVLALAESYRTVSDKLLSVGQTAESYEAAKRAVELCEKVLPSHPDDAGLMDELARDYEAVADLLGGNFNLGNLGDREGAMAARHKDIEFSQRLAQLRPNDPSAQRKLAAAVVRMGDQLLLNGRRHEASDQYSQALSALQTLAAQSPTPQLQDNVHAVYQRINNVQMADGRYVQAVQSARSALEISRRLNGSDPRDAWARLSVADDLDNLADALSHLPGKREAVASIEKALSILSGLVAQDPNNIELQGSQSAMLETAGDIYRRAGDSKSALAYCRRALDLTSKIYAKDPKNEDARLRLTADYNSLAGALADHGDTSQARAIYDKALGVAASAENASLSPNQEVLYARASSYTGLGDLELRLAKREKHSERQAAHVKKAAALFRESLKAWSAIPEPGTLSPDGFEAIPPPAVSARLKRCEEALAAATARK